MSRWPTRQHPPAGFLHALDRLDVAVNSVVALEDHPAKRIFDAAGALLAVLAMAIPMVAIHLLVLWDVGRPTIFQQVRLGKGQRRYTLYKFRSMTDARDARGELLPDAQRVTPLGQFLRRFRLDELPELYNVLRGDMSLVGPRPLPSAVVASFGRLAVERSKVRPGLTGWAQVNGNTLLSNEEKLALDLWYVGHCNLWTDLKILLKTAAVVVRGERRNNKAIKKAVHYANRTGRGCRLNARCS